MGEGTRGHRCAQDGSSAGRALMATAAAAMAAQGGACSHPAPSSLLGTHRPGRTYRQGARVWHGDRLQAGPSGQVPAWHSPSHLTTATWAVPAPGSQRPLPAWGDPGNSCFWPRPTPARLQPERRWRRQCSAVTRRQCPPSPTDTALPAEAGPRLFPGLHPHLCPECHRGPRGGGARGFLTVTEPACASVSPSV